MNYLTVLRDGVFCVYWSDDVVSAMADEFEVVNSTARRVGEFDAQKVLLRREGRNVGELEMRNSSPTHYAEVLFNMNREPCLALLDGAGFKCHDWSPEVRLHGKAIRTFGNW